MKDYIYSIIIAIVGIISYEGTMWVCRYLDGNLNKPVIPIIKRNNIAISNTSKHNQLYNDSTYWSIIDWIKVHEGYRAEPYRCLAGKVTVGYGHVITKDDIFKLPVEEEIADSILIADFDFALNYVNTHSDLKGNQLLAMAHFAFCLGIGNFERLYNHRVRKHGHKIDDWIVKYIHIKTPNGKVIKSNYLLKLRLKELEIYKTK